MRKVFGLFGSQAVDYRVSDGRRDRRRGADVVRDVDVASEYVGGSGLSARAEVAEAVAEGLIGAAEVCLCCGAWLAESAPSLSCRPSWTTFADPTGCSVEMDWGYIAGTACGSFYVCPECRSVFFEDGELHGKGRPLSLFPGVRIAGAFPAARVRVGQGGSE